jgi:hypothetical protein
MAAMTHPNQPMAMLLDEHGEIADTCRTGIRDARWKSAVDSIPKL